MLSVDAQLLRTMTEGSGSVRGLSMMTRPRMHHEMQVQRMDLAARRRRTETLLHTDPHFLSSQEATSMEGTWTGRAS